MTSAPLPHPTARVPTISVVVPCYNATAVLRRTIEALLVQTVQPEEIIVVDDGSSDNSAAVAAAFGPPVRVVRQTNSGAASARFRGVIEAKSDFIAFNDAGDVSRPRRLEWLRQALIDHPHCVASYAQTWLSDRAEPTFSKVTGRALDGSCMVVDDAFDKILGRSWPLAQGMNLAIRREVAMRSVDVAHFYRAGNDYALQVNTARFGPFVYVSAVGMECEILEGGLTKTNGWFQQTGYALCSAVECVESINDGTPYDRAAFRKRIEDGWPGIVLHMMLRRNFPLARRVAAIGLRWGRLRMIPRRLWWALDRAWHEGALDASPGLRRLVGAVNRMRGV
jgi:glycosyltransferase involved in cell wall biosynthesis